MIIFLTELQKQHLGVLHQRSIQVLVDFCKLALDFLNNGPNFKKYTIAAEKLSMSITDVQNVIHALVHLIVEGCEHNLSESDFKSSLAIAGFSNEQQEMLLKFYITKKIELSEALYLLKQKDPTYQDFMWRFEVQIASKNKSDEIKPTITLNFVTMTSKQYSEIKEDKKDNRSTKSVIDTSIQESKAANHCQHVITHNLVQSDIPNLIHLTNKLEQALKESKSQHVRKVQRSL
ncbi:COMM domain-containing protein 2-like isoform X1 [Manduca sexta]|uniref:COMM domain-containing protein 2-like isoform X1 n=1 Tax=Manduca sexta TaxID=7130 RepID=UPI00188DFE87|nr:COMM domain-containing protein 2-like isoform X1 [Manduca sexta]